MQSNVCFERPYDAFSGLRLQNANVRRLFPSSRATFPALAGIPDRLQQTQISGPTRVCFDPSQIYALSCGGDRGGGAEVGGGECLSSFHDFPSTLRSLIVPPLERAAAAAAAPFPPLFRSLRQVPPRLAVIPVHLLPTPSVFPICPASRRQRKSEESEESREVAGERNGEADGD